MLFVLADQKLNMQLILENALLSAEDGLVQSGNQIWFHFQKYSWDFSCQEKNPGAGKHRRLPRLRGLPHPLPGIGDPGAPQGGRHGSHPAPVAPLHRLRRRDQRASPEEHLPLLLRRLRRAENPALSAGLIRRHPRRLRPDGKVPLDIFILDEIPADPNLIEFV